MASHHVRPIPPATTLPMGRMEHLLHSVYRAGGRFARVEVRVCVVCEDYDEAGVTDV